MGRYEWDSFYLVSGSVLSVYKEVMNRLYTGNKLSGDEVRDLANRMEAVLSSAYISEQVEE